MSPRTIFEQQLTELQEEIKRIGLTVECNYDDLFASIKSNDIDTVVRIIKSENGINEMKRSIESKCLSLLMRQQPVARDLRMITASLKVVTDIARIGDICCDMAELISREKLKSLDHFSENLEIMANTARKQEHNAVSAFTGRSIDQAMKVISGDDDVDDLFNKVKEDIVRKIKSESLSADDCVDGLMFAKYLEKIGDHAVNIGQWEVFQETGNMEDQRLL